MSGVRASPAGEIVVMDPSSRMVFAGVRSIDTRECKECSVAQGTVKWFNDTKGFGFVSQPGGEDIFVHHTAIMAEGFRTLPEGASVEFDIVQGPKGLQAANVRLL